MASELIEAAVAAIKAGEPVILPTDTVYGLCADPYRREPAGALFRLKRRPETMPVALMAAELDRLLDAVPELHGRGAVAARALLPGPYTLVLPNPAQRFPWLCGGKPEKIGLRVPLLPAPTRAVLDRVGVVAATSANLHGGIEPARIADVPDELRSGVGAIVDASELPGTPSTVIDLTGDSPTILRAGAVSADDVLRRLDAMSTWPRPAATSE